MKRQFASKLRGKLAALALLCGLSVTTVLGATLPTISVNFEGCCGDNGGTIGPTPLLPGDSAGLVPHTNWNSINGNNVHGTALIDSNGVATTTTIFFDADESWASETGTGTGDDKMFRGYLGISNDGNYRPLLVSNVVNGAYKLIIYNVQDGRQDNAYTINANTLNTLHITHEGRDDWTGNRTFRRAVSTNPGARDVGNYVQFDQVQPINGIITIDCRSESFRGIMNGFQLVALDPAAFRFVNQPQDLTRDSGQNATFVGTTVDGVAPVVYQWYTNGVADSVNGLTESYTRSGIAANENGRTFQLVATDGASISITSRVATLTVRFLAFTSEPANAARAVGQNITFSGSATSGTPPYTYQWRTNGVVDPAATSSSYTRNGLAANENNRTFQLIVRDAASVSITSRVAVLSVVYGISVNFVGGNDAGAPTFMNASDAAGVVDLQNWNNVQGANVQGLPLVDGAGAASPVTIFFSADEEWASGAGTSDANHRMLNGYLGTSNGGNNTQAPVGGPYNFGNYRPVFLNNVPNEAYKLIIYNVRGDRQAQGYTVNSDTAKTLHINTASVGDFNANGFVRGTSTNTSPARDICSYVQFDEVHPVNGTITIDCRAENFRAEMNGLQLVAFDPAVFHFKVLPLSSTRYPGQNAVFTSEVTGGTPGYTYQWFTNGVADTTDGLSATYPRNGIGANENGRTFYVVATDSTSATITSPTATLTVLPNRNISLNFVGRGGGYYIDPTDTAGVVALTNWNNNQASGEQAAAPGDSGLLKDDLNNLTPVTVHWECNDSWNTGTSFPGPNGDYKMMKGMAKDGGTSAGHFNFRNLPPDAAFDLYVYTAVNNGGGLPGNVRYDIWVTNQASSASGTTSRTNYNRMPDTFNGVFSQAENYNPAGPYPGGYYVKFTNILASPSGNLFIGHKAVSGGDGAGFPGIQLIRRADVTIPALTLVNGALAQTPSPAFDGSSYTLSGPTVSGIGARSYQWQTNTANDLSGTWVNVPGANSASYSAVSPFTDNGRQFRVIVGNLYPSYATSSPIALNLIQDVTRPTLVRALGAAYRTSVNLKFSEPMLVSEANNATNYSIPGLTVNSAAISSDGTEVTLGTTTQSPGVTYTVTVTGLHDRAFVPNVLNPNPSVANFTASDLTFVPGGVLFRAYNVGGGNNIPLLTNNALFPNSPDFTASISGFNSSLAGGVYANNSREAFGASIVGHFIAPSSGNWIFYVSADDDGLLIMNTNGPSSVAKKEVRFAPGCCRALSGGSDPTPPISLVAGQAYYIEGLYKEGTGGDYLQVGARKVGDNSAIVPIGSANLAFGYSLNITQQPASITNYQNQPVSFTVGATVGGVGIPPSYQWQRSTDTNGVTTFTNIPGATASSLMFLSLIGDDNYQFRCLVYLPTLQTNTSSAATLNVRPDLDPPFLVSATTDDGFGTITLTYNEVMNSGPATEVSSYVITGPAGPGDPLVNSVQTNANGRSFTLILSAPMQQNTLYTVDAYFQEDLAHNLPATEPVTTNVLTRIISRGFVNFQAYTSIGTVPDPNNLSFLLNHPSYPNSPSFSFLTNQVNWPQTVPNVENYGMRFSGLFIAPVDGSYSFKAIHDDGARVNFSTDASEANKTAILNENCCNGGYTGANSSPVNLLAGQRYYFELIVLEGGGGDYAGLGVNIPGGGFVAPIPGSMLALSYPGGSVTGAGIAQQPANTSVEENHSATFSVLVTNAPSGAFYQWQLNGSDIAGANLASYTTPIRTLANNGDIYRVIVSVPGVYITSSGAVLTVTSDVTKPTVVRARSDRGSTNLIIRFSEIVTVLSAQNPANYALTNAQGDAIALGTPVLSGDSLSVTIPTLSNLGYGSNYTVHVEGIQDIASIANTMNPTNLSFTTWTVGLGSLLFDVYGGLDASQVLTAFTNQPAYPDSPTISAHIASADSRRFYSDDSHDGYGGRMSGSIVPPINGNYTFYMSADDDAELRLSPDNNQANRANIIFLPSCCQPFSAHASSSISLLGGQPYALEMVYKEGVGGDFGQVAAKLTADPTNPDTLSTIPGAYLSSLADPVGASITITQQPISTNVIAGATVTLSVGLTSTNDYGDYNQVAYQWQQYVGGSWVSILGATSPTYTTTPLAAGDNRQYRARIYIPGANTTSSAANINGPGLLTITRINASTNRVSWTGGGTLQSAPEATGPWTDTPLQTNPQDFDILNPRKFFKLR